MKPKGYSELEWSGVCRATPHRNFNNHYWAISDSSGKNDNYLYLVDHFGDYCAMYPVLSPGGGKIQNSDWEDISIDDRGNIWILDNIKNRGGAHQLLKLSEPKEFGDAAKLDKIYTFQLKEDVEAIFCHDGKPYIISKNANEGGFIAFNKILAPIMIYELEYENDDKCLVESWLHCIKTLTGCTGFCTAADYIDDMLLIHCHMRDYILQWPGAEVLWSLDLDFGQTEGACFARGGEFIVIQNEAGEYGMENVEDFIQW